MKHALSILFSIILLTNCTLAQLVIDDFEGNGTLTWADDDCGLDTNFPNPFQQSINTSATVLEYNDTGGQYANIRFDIDQYFDLADNHTFSFKIFVVSNSLTGNAPNQVSLKLQNGNLAAPWSTQSEIIKPISLDEWQTVNFNFETDNYINLDPNSLPPTQRLDFNRVLIQINGENNNDHVLAYIDDFNYDGVVPVEPEFNNLIWADEFDTNGDLDQLNWFRQYQLPQPGSWYNGEIQHYTNRIDNSYVEDGLLKIVARKETYTDQGETKEYTSARLNSKFAFTYGKVEIRAKLPSGVGTWPALWMLGKNIDENGAYWDNMGYGTTPWPACGEMDIMEHWGSNQNYVSSATHTPSSYGNTVNVGGQMIPGASNDFHTYALTWTAEKLVFSVDDVIHYTYDPPIKNQDTWPFDEEYYLIFNTAILPGIDPNFTESAMEIDYVRIYQDNTTATENIPDQQTLKFYPNPVDNELTINLEEDAGEHIVLKLYDINGAFIKEFTALVIAGQVKLQNFKALAKGTYILNIESLKKKYSLKFIKN